MWLQGLALASAFGRLVSMPIVNICLTFVFVAFGTLGPTQQYLWILFFWRLFEYVFARRWNIDDIQPGAPMFVHEELSWSDGGN